MVVVGDDFDTNVPLLAEKPERHLKTEASTSKVLGYVLRTCTDRCPSTTILLTDANTGALFGPNCGTTNQLNTAQLSRNVFVMFICYPFAVVN